VTRVSILAEGQSEETFVRELVAPHLLSRKVYATAILAKTKHTVGRSFKGGITRYEPVRRDLLNLLRDKDVAVVTTLVDYYHLPNDFPGADRAVTDCAKRAAHIEDEWRKNIDDSRFRPYLSMHEYEALLFASPDEIAALAPARSRPKVLEELQRIVGKFGSIEEINDGPDTSPAKRITTLIPEYRKPLGGVLIAQAIGLQPMRAASPRFDAWMTMLESLAP